MPIETPRFINPNSPTPAERIARFDYQTEFVSSMAAMRGHQDYQVLVEMGSEAIPLILDALQERPTWTALALNELTGQDVTGLNSNTTKTQGITAKQVRENTLTWAEEESFIEIRDPKERIKTGLDLYTELRHALVNNPDSAKALAGNFFSPRTITAMGTPNYPYKILREIMSEASGTFITLREEAVLVRNVRERIHNVETHSLFLVFPRGNSDSLAVSIARRKGEPTNATFLAGDLKPNTRRSAQAFREIVGRLLPTAATT